MVNDTLSFVVAKGWEKRKTGLDWLGLVTKRAVGLTSIVISDICKVISSVVVGFANYK